MRHVHLCYMQRVRLICGVVAGQLGWISIWKQFDFVLSTWMDVCNIGYKMKYKGDQVTTAATNREIYSATTFGEEDT